MQNWSSFLADRTNQVRRCLQSESGQEAASATGMLQAQMPHNIKSTASGPNQELGAASQHHPECRANAACEPAAKLVVTDGRHEGGFFPIKYCKCFVQQDETKASKMT